jgi:hypothetical protein
MAGGADRGGDHVGLLDMESPTRSLALIPRVPSRHPGDLVGVTHDAVLPFGSTQLDRGEMSMTSVRW